MFYVGKSLNGFVGYDGQRTVLGKPGHVLGVFFAHGLFYENYIFFFQPVNHIQRHFFVGPALIYIYAKRKIGDRTYGFNDFFVVVPSEFYFKYFVLISCFKSFFFYNIRSVNADCERCVGGVVFRKSPYFINGLIQYFACQVV
ncbi:hypothetical protein SDC9_171491 [bioreactor metagenome]|uniref:Uncharacterized protein n=1 Tax=bioreactor metagenome TaxID=1076179 RepID=A0A645GB07_9ZZZZ